MCCSYRVIRFRLNRAHVIILREIIRCKVKTIPTSDPSSRRPCPANSRSARPPRGSAQASSVSTTSRWSCSKRGKTSSSTEVLASCERRKANTGTGIKKCLGKNMSDHDHSRGTHYQEEANSENKWPKKTACSRIILCLLKP